MSIHRPCAGRWTKATATQRTRHGRALLGRVLVCGGVVSLLCPGVSACVFEVIVI